LGILRNPEHIPKVWKELEVDPQRYVNIREYRDRTEGTRQFFVNLENFPSFSISISTSSAAALFKITEERRNLTCNFYNIFIVKKNGATNLGELCSLLSV